MAREIPLTKGYLAIVDDADFGWLSRWKWSASENRGGKLVYAMARTSHGKARMHRLIMAAPAGIFIDHINHNGLDNRRANLRFCTHTDNNRNRRPAGSSPFKGIEVLPSRRYRASLWKNGPMRLGIYDTAEEAARAYDRAAREHFGEFAYLNFPEAA